MIKPIAYIKSPFIQKFGVPRQSGRAKNVVGYIEFLPEFSNKEAFRGIENFSHLWIIFDFSLSHRNEFSPTVRPPRLGGNERVGVFATRSPFRPNNIGLSSVKFEGIEFKNGRAILTVSGIDIIDNTPVYDVKPYIKYTDCHEDAISGFATDFENYRLQVNVSSELLSVVDKNLQVPLIECLQDDPRPSYIDDNTRVYKMNFDKYQISFVVNEKQLTVTEIIVL